MGQLLVHCRGEARGDLDCHCREWWWRDGARPVEADLINNDDDAGVRLAVEHLTDQCHERIAYVTMFQRAAMRARERAYREAVREAGLDYHLVLPWIEDVVDRLSRPGTSGKAPTAVFVSNDRGLLWWWVRPRTPGLACRAS